MYVYLLHSFVLYPFRESGVLRDLEPTWLWLPIVVVASVLIALGLATKPVRWRVPAARRAPAAAGCSPTRRSPTARGIGRDPTGSRRPPRGAARARADPRQNG